MEEGSKQESTKTTLLRGIARCVELIEKNHPEIAKKVKAKDVPFEEIVSELEKVIDVQVTGKGVHVYILKRGI